MVGAKGFAGLLLLILTAGQVNAQENLNFKPPPDWDLANTQQTRDQLLLEFVRKGEKIDNWTELLTLQQFRRGRGSPPPRGFYESLRQTREKNCPGITEWTVLEEAESVLLYEWKTTAACEKQPPQSELARLIFGRNTGYRAAYATRAPLTPEVRTKWLEWLGGLSMGR